MTPSWIESLLTALTASVPRLRIIGTSRNGRVVLGAEAKGKCSNRSFWELSPNNIDSPTGARVIPEYPKCLSSSAEIESLETGTLLPTKAGLTERCAVTKAQFSQMKSTYCGSCSECSLSWLRCGVRNVIRYACGHLCAKSGSDSPR
jgi:hypothetical protein